MIKIETKTGWIVFAVALVMGIAFATIFGGAIWEIFDDPKSNTSETIFKYQTFLGGLAAILAAIFTALVIYISASMPIRAEEFKLKKKALRDEIITACILGATISALYGPIRLSKLSVETNTNYKPIFIPDQLKDFEMIACQTPDIARRIAEFTSSVGLHSALCDQSVFETEEGKDRTLVKFQETLDMSDKLVSDLQKIATKKDTGKT